AVGSYPRGHRGGLWGAVEPAGDQDHLVPWPDEIDQLRTFYVGIRRDAACHAAMMPVRQRAAFTRLSVTDETLSYPATTVRRDLAGCSPASVGPRAATARLRGIGEQRRPWLTV